jgi:16S rRNA (cytosine967-C5)-methyltransferase
LNAGPTIHAQALHAAAQALAIVLRFEQPADAILSGFFQQHRALAQNDRRFVAEAVFGVLRHKRVLDHLTHTGSPRALVLAWLARFSGSSVREVSSIVSAAEIAAMGELKAMRVDELPLAVRAELPDWVVERLRSTMADSEILTLGQALQSPAPLDLRVNILKTDRDTAVRTLIASGIAAGPTPYSPVAIRVPARTALNHEPLFLSGQIEVQDEGSQLVGYLVAPRRRDLTVDFCAGAGGKALMLGAMMNNQGRVYAFDVSAARLTRLKPRLKRSGLSNLHPHLLRNEHDVKVKRLAGKIDRVLVDAPCSGLGTLRRNPDLKWRQSPESVSRMNEKQVSILSAASTLLKPGGRLVYATCSLLREENEAVVEAFLAEHPLFAALDCAELLRGQGISIDTGRVLRLWPHVHGTDGFFAAALERRV